MKKKTKSGKAGSTNYNDVLIKLIDSVYNLINSGNIVGVILLFFCFQVYYITTKLSGEMLDNYLKNVFSIDFFYFLPLCVALSFSVFVNFYQKKVYKAHINELIETRNRLIHGLKTGELQALKKHNSSGINSMESENDC